MTVLRWPADDPVHGAVRLRAFAPDDPGDVAMACDLATDPYVPLVGTLPAHADEEQARAYVERQVGRLAEGVGWSFCIADRGTGRALGQVGLWVRDQPPARASAGYAVAPSARGRGVAADALRAVTAFAWSGPGMQRVELYVEPDNAASLATARAAGYREEGLLPRHREIGGTWRDMLLYALDHPSKP